MPRFILNDMNVREAIYFCILEDLQRSFREDPVFTMRLDGGKYPVSEGLARKMISMGKKGPFIEVVLSRHGWRGSYEINIEDGCVSIYHEVGCRNYGYHVTSIRYDANDPNLSDVSTRIRYAILQDAMVTLSANGETEIARRQAIPGLSSGTKGSFVFYKNELDKPITDGLQQTNGRLELVVKEVTSSVARENAYDPITLCKQYNGELLFDGEPNVSNGVFALSLGSKMLQTGLVHFGLLRRFQIEDPGIYEIVVHVFASQPRRVN